MKLVSGKLSNEKFVSKAPEALVNAEREKLADYEDKHAVVLKTFRRTEKYVIIYNGLLR